MISQPRMVGRALDGEIKRKLDTVSGRRFAQEPKVIKCAERGMDCIVTAFGAANRVWAAHVIGLDYQAVVFALAIGATDGMDRWQVEDIESHTLYARQMPDDVPERPVAVRF